MRILWHSNAPWVSTGYGQQTAIFCRLLAEAGHEVVIRAFYGLNGAVVQWGPIDVLPASYHLYGADVLAEDWRRYRPDAHVMLIDSWVFDAQVLRQGPFTTWAPIDHEPMPRPVQAALTHFRHVWAMSRFGEREMRRLGLDPHYVPHGIDVQTFRPIDHKASREIYGVADDQLFVVCVAANKGNPPRKNLDRILKAWSIFLEKHPRAFLWMHTEPLGVHQGVNLGELCAFYGVPISSIKFANPYLLSRGDYTADWMNQLYNAADVFLLPSRGEGFGIPAVEAQASGCPVIVSDFTAQRELGAAGYRIPIDRVDDLEVSGQGSDWALPKVSEILRALDWAVENKDNPTLRERARDFAMQYDARDVLRKYMLPALEYAAAYDKDVIGKRPEKVETPKVLMGAAD